jgi:hypothetical protein
VGALPQATSKQRTNKHKWPGKVVSFKDSNGNDGCRLHIWATDHTTMECRVIQKQITENRPKKVNLLPRGLRGLSTRRTVLEGFGWGAWELALTKKGINTLCARSSCPRVRESESVQ